MYRFLQKPSYLCLICLIFGAFFFPISAFSQNADTTKIVVSATRTAIPAQFAPFHVEVISRAVFHETGQRSLADALAQHSLIFLKQYGNSGLASVSLRGTNASQTALLLDGFRLSDPQLGQVDLSLFPLMMVQSVEVLHGAASSLYGSSAMGGAVQMNTAKLGNESNTPIFNSAVRYEKGAFSMQNVASEVSVNAKKWGIQVASLDQRAENNFSYSENGKMLKRENADRHDITQWISLFGKMKQHQLRANGWFTNAKRGLPAPMGQSASSERQNDQSRRFWLTDEWHHKNVLLKIGGMWQENEMRYENPAWNYVSESQTLSTQLLAQAQWLISRNTWLNGGVQYEKAKATSESLTQDANENALGVYVNAMAKKGNFRFFPALRMDQRSGFETVVSPTLGVNYAAKTTTTSALHFKASAGRVFRAPTLNDRFWQGAGNPDLKPEDGWQTDFGMLWQNAAFQLEVSGFATRLENQIVWQPQPQNPNIWSPFNVQKTQTHGAEASVKYTQTSAIGKFSQGISAQYLEAQEVSDASQKSHQKQLAYIPKTQLKAFGTWQKGNFTTSVSLRHIGKRFITNDESQSLPSFFVGDAAFKLEKKVKRIETAVFLNMENIFNAQYAVIQNYPMPPRHLKAGISVRI